MNDPGPDVTAEVFVGVDTHKHTHHAALVDPLGRHLGDRGFTADGAGYEELLAWIIDAGTVVRVGVEGTSSYGAGLCAVLRAAGLVVVEVDRADRRARRSRGKSDEVDAYAAAVAAASGRARTVPKSRDGEAEAIRLLHTTRAGAVQSRKRALTALQSMRDTSPEPLRAVLRPYRTGEALARACAEFTPDAITPGAIVAAAQTAMRSLALRIEHLVAEIAALDKQLDMLTKRAVPELRALQGVGPETAAQLVTTLGDNPERIGSEAALANLCGVAPRQASSGKTVRHRLSRAGDRQANRALHTIALTRKRHDSRTRDYVARRTEEGKTDLEIMRCLKRYIAREIHRIFVVPRLDTT